MSRTRKIRSHYEHRITSERENFDVLDWSCAESQQTRFAVLADNVDLAGASLLDIGCGLGDLWAFLNERGIDVDYTGVDILEKMVLAARDRHTDARFIRADVFGADPFGGRTFDVVFCSGAMNLNLGNNRRFLPVAVARMLELANRTAVVNLLHARAAASDRTYFYHDPGDVGQLLSHLPCEIRIIQDYLPNDFTVICSKAVISDR